MNMFTRTCQWYPSYAKNQVHTQISNLFNICFSIILPFTPRSPEQIRISQLKFRMQFSFLPSVLQSCCSYFIIVILSIYRSTTLVDLDLFLSFLIYTQSVGFLGLGDQPFARPLPTHRTTQTQISMSRVRFEPTTPVFERAKTSHALDRATTVNGIILVPFYKKQSVLSR
jgi:hypothetical protein